MFVNFSFKREREVGKDIWIEFVLFWLLLVGFEKVVLIIM